MELQDVLSPKSILIDWVPDSKDGAIIDLVNKLAEADMLLDKQLVIEDVFAREESLSTGLEDGIAYPHARSEAVDSVVMAFGIVKDGLDFGLRDGSLAVFIPLMVSPSDGGSPHIYFMAEIVKKLENQEIRKKLMDAETPEEVYHILTQ
jgi:mannitol/fructose-specific phosphotransferase system IIA component (Ntr-type)